MYESRPPPSCPPQLQNYTAPAEPGFCEFNITIGECNYTTGNIIYSISSQLPYMEHVHNYHIWNMFTITIYRICSQLPYIEYVQLPYIEYVHNYLIRCQYGIVLLCHKVKSYLVQSLFKDFSV